MTVPSRLRVTFLCGSEVLLRLDSNGELAHAMGVELGIWSQRYVLLAEDGVVKVLNLKEGGKITNSNAEDMLSISRRVAYSPISRHSTSPTSGTTSTWEAACAHEAFNFFL